MPKQVVIIRQGGDWGIPQRIAKLDLPEHFDAVAPISAHVALIMSDDEIPYNGTINKDVLMDTIKELWRSGRKISAIKLLREYGGKEDYGDYRYHIGLKEAKDYLEYLADKNSWTLYQR